MGFALRNFERNADWLRKRKRTRIAGVRDQRESCAIGEGGSFEKRCSARSGGRSAWAMILRGKEPR